MSVNSHTVNWSDNDKNVTTLVIGLLNVIIICAGRQFNEELEYIEK